MLFLIALEMVFARESGTKTTNEEKTEVQQRADISVFPLAFPFIAGPGALATVLLTFGTLKPDVVLTVGLLAVIALILAITLAMMLLTPLVNRVMGVTGAHVVSRLAGVVLAALAVQFMIDGLKGAFV
jgi:multiple antibiotic resistance protein